MAHQRGAGTQLSASKGRHWWEMNWKRPQNPDSSKYKCLWRWEEAGSGYCFLSPAEGGMDPDSDTRGRTSSGGETYKWKQGDEMKVGKLHRMNPQMIGGNFSSKTEPPSAKILQILTFEGPCWKSHVILMGLQWSPQVEKSNELTQNFPSAFQRFSLEYE